MFNFKSQQINRSLQKREREKKKKHFVTANWVKSEENVQI